MYYTDCEEIITTELCKHDIHVFVPDFQLHPTFSERPPTNGVKTRLVKMCRGQHAAADLLLCVKTTLTMTGNMS